MEKVSRWRLSRWKTRLGKAMGDKDDEEGEGPVGAHNVTFGVGDAKADSSGRGRTGYRSSGESLVGGAGP